MADITRLNGLSSTQLPLATSNAAAAARLRASEAAGTDSQPAAQFEASAPRQNQEEQAAERLRNRQDSLLSIDTRISALESAGKLLAAAKTGDEAGRQGLAGQAGELAAKLQAGGEFGKALAQLANGTVDQGTIKNAEFEVAGQMLVARSEASAGRQALANEMVALENETASRVEVENVSRAAAPLKGQGVPEDLQALTEALQAAPMNRGRVLDLLVGGGR